MSRIGNYKLETQNNGTVYVPVFELSDDDLDSDVYDMVRVETDSGTGFIPFTDTSKAAHDYVRINTQNHGTLALNDDKWNQEIIDSWEDQDQNISHPDWSGWNKINENGDYYVQHWDDPSTAYDGDIYHELNVNNAADSGVTSIEWQATRSSKTTRNLGFTMRFGRNNTSDDAVFKAYGDGNNIFTIDRGTGSNSEYWEINNNTTDIFWTGWNEFYVILDYSTGDIDLYEFNTYGGYEGSYSMYKNPGGCDEIRYEAVYDQIQFDYFYMV